MRCATLSHDDTGPAVRSFDERGVPGERLCGVVEANLLAMDGDRAARAVAGAAMGAPAVVCWSGGLATGLFGRDPRTWMPDGRAALDCLCDALVGAGPRVVFRPHCRHVLSDATACASFLGGRRGGGFGVLLDPVALLEAPMLATVEDHVSRAFETLGPLADAVLLRDVAPPSDGDGPDALPEPRPVGQGMLGATVLAALLRDHCGPETLVIVEGGDPGAQAAALGA